MPTPTHARRQRQPRPAPSVTTTQRVDLPRPRVPHRAARHRRRRRRGRGRWCARGPREAAAIAVTGVREARAAGLVRRRARRHRAGQAGDDRRPGHRRPRAARRAAGVGRPARADRDAGVLQQRPHRGARRASTTNAPRGILREYTDNIEFADPLLRFDLPAKLDRATRCSGLAAAAALWPVRHLLPASVKSQITAPGARLSHALARTRRPGLRRRGRARTTSSSASASRTSPARRSSPPRSPTSGSPTWPTAASTWCSTRRRSRSPSPSPRPCSRR